MKSLAMRLEDVISGQTYDAAVLRDAKQHVTCPAQMIAINRFLRGANSTQDWRELQELVITIRMKELSAINVHSAA